MTQLVSQSPWTALTKCDGHSHKRYGPMDIGVHHRNI